MFSWKAFLLLVTALRAYRVNSKRMRNYANKLTGQINTVFGPKHMVTGIYTGTFRRWDRVWKFDYGTASTPFGIVTCSNVIRSGILNAYTKPFSYSCPAFHAITGFFSRFSRQAGDRQWAIRCCKISNARLEDKAFTKDLNSAGGNLDFSCAIDEVLVGLKSVFSRKSRDRVWQAQCARLAAYNAIVLNSQLSTWLNDWDLKLHFGGEKNIAITGLYSVHHNGPEDRRWKVRFGSIVGTSRKKGQSSNKRPLCLERGGSAWRSTMRKYLMFTCKGGRLLNGISSVHSNFHEDRRWIFSCCKLSPGFSVEALEWSPFLNKYNQVVDFQCEGSDQALIGLSSVYDRKHRDRRWKARCGVLIRNRQL